MSTYFWVSPTPSNWNNILNWSTTSGGSGGVSIPGADSTVIFDSNSTGSCVLDMSVIIDSLFLLNGYNSTVTKNSNSVTVTNIAFFDGGSFLGDSSIRVGSIYMGYGIFQDTTVYISQDVSCASTHNQWSSVNNSNLILDGIGQQNVYVEAGGIIPTLIVNKTDSTHVLCYGESPIIIKDDFLIQDGTFNTNGLDVQVGI
jgi:hypothetical protein